MLTPVCIAYTAVYYLYVLFKTFMIFSLVTQNILCKSFVIITNLTINP